MAQQTLQSIKGVGEKRAQQLERLGVHSVEALLSHYPRGYRDYSKSVDVSAVRGGMDCAVKIRLVSPPKFYRAGGMSILSVRGEDDTGAILLKWFNQPYRSKQVRQGMEVYACGLVQSNRGLSMINPQLSEELPGILPVYPTVKGVPQRTIRQAVMAALKGTWDQIGETLPPQMIRSYGLCTRQLALRQIHFPTSMELMKLALRRVEFERMLLYLLAVEQEKERRKHTPGIPFDVSGVKETYLSKLPFRPTNAQTRAMAEIAKDMEAPSPMNRLLQGDVGSGKTAVALFALCVAGANGYQGAFLAPTEILAAQHYQQARSIFGDAAVLLTGSMHPAEREAALARIADGRAFCVVGTHALFQQSVQFYKLGLVVTDEQHRFGVQQRARMQDKGMRPDVLVMSATPIPRTLAMLICGDLDMSVLDELPPGRKPVKTSIISENRRMDMYRYIAKQAQQGVQAYVVCPLIEDSEELELPSVEQVTAELKKEFPTLRAAALHGRMKEPQKQKTIQDFRDGKLDVLVSTTVIEVGVHVENAAIMAIEGAERFGLSQLHQLRGRVGRGQQQSYCFLLTKNQSDQAMERLEVLAKSGDGFYIAQRDLELRGPGDFFGTRQHGDSTVPLPGAGCDLALLTQAKQAAREVVETPSAVNNELLERALTESAARANGIAMN